MIHTGPGLVQPATRTGDSDSGARGGSGEARQEAALHREEQLGRLRGGGPGRRRRPAARAGWSVTQIEAGRARCAAAWGEERGEGEYSLFKGMANLAYSSPIQGEEGKSEGMAEWGVTRMGRRARGWRI